VSANPESPKPSEAEASSKVASDESIAPTVNAKPAPKPKPPFARRHKKKLIALAVLLTLPLVFHFGVAALTRLTPPSLPNLSSVVVSATENGVTRVGPAYKRKRGKILEVRLVGTPAEIGDEHAKLLYEEMVGSEGQLYKAFEKYVPLSPVRHLVVDIGKFQFRHVDRGISSDRLTEFAAQARAFSPDPFEGYIPTFQRFVYLQSLYDISLSFEHSPLLGCTSFVATGKATKDGHTYLARNFDFEAGSVFDDGKVVFLIEEKGKIPYASVAWPGFVGTVSGMNAKGVSVVIHGGRARETSEDGEPVVHTTRAILAEASTVDEAIAIVQSRKAMVSHILLVADASGDAAVIERAPGEAPFVRRATGLKLPLTNTFEGPFATDPKNLSILAHTSSKSRRSRLDELLAPDAPLDPPSIVDILRDKNGVDGLPRTLGDRSTIDAVIATHGVVMDSTARILWVSEGPHLMGRFVKFDLEKLLAPDFNPKDAEGDDDPVEAIPADPTLLDGRYDAWVKAGSKHQGVQK
jgi:isopenicillin-N N-acyltransferase-like protein